MNQNIMRALLIGSIFITGFCFKENFSGKPKPLILVFSKTTGYHHQSIPDGVAAIQKMGEEKGFGVDTTTNAAWFKDEVLKKYKALVFLNTTDSARTLLGTEGELALQRYVRAGGGFVGIHAATDAEYSWEWYGKMIGAYFESHPKIQQATLHIVDATHPATRNLPKEWTRTDEWYNFKNLSKDMHVLITIDEQSYTGGKNGYHPMSWYHEFEGGRIFYTELGHTSESYKDPLYLGHLAGGIQYAMGRKASPRPSLSQP
jgi:type 1 glutamine amidotransferase